MMPWWIQTAQFGSPIPATGFFSITRDPGRNSNCRHVSIASIRAPVTRTPSPKKSKKPNGICFSPNESKLYVADTGVSHKPDHPRHIRVYDVVDGKRLANGRMFCDMAPGLADGIRCDTEGNLWASAGWAGEGYDGVHVFAPDGSLIGKINLPEICSNLCFGGVKRNRLFMTGSQSLYAVYVETQGAQVP